MGEYNVLVEVTKISIISVPILLMFLLVIHLANMQVKELIRSYKELKEYEKDGDKRV